MASITPSVTPLRWMLDRNRVVLRDVIGHTLTVLTALYDRDSGQRLAILAGETVIYRGQEGKYMQVTSLAGTTARGMYAAKLAPTQATVDALKLNPQRFPIYGAVPGGAIILHGAALGEDTHAFLGVVIEGGTSHGKELLRMSKMGLVAKGGPPTRWFRFQSLADHYRTTGEVLHRQPAKAS